MENSIVALRFEKNKSEDDLPTLLVTAQRIAVSSIVSVIQYNYSHSDEAIKKQTEMYNLSQKTFFEVNSNYALVTDNKNNQYLLTLNYVSEEFAKEYLKVVEI